MDPRQALDHHLRSALRLARAIEQLGDENVHEVRKHLKRARAALRLLRDAVTRDAYARENALLRDAARIFAPVRDTAVMLERLETMRESVQEPGERARLEQLREQLHAKHAGQLRRLASDAPAKVAAPIEAVAQRAARWRVPHDAWPIIASGLRRIYRKGREAVDAARERGSDAALHEARKQAKYLEAALSVLEPVKAPRLRKLASAADTVATRLGDDHDMAVLAGLLRRNGGGEDALAEVARRRRRWQKKALKRAQKLYKRKPKAFIRKAAPRNSRRASAPLLGT